MDSRYLAIPNNKSQISQTLPINHPLNMSSVRTPSQSRIIQRKQIQKRLQNLSLKQLQRISSNLIRQNQKLKQEVKTFNQKVQKLMQSKKYQSQFKPNPFIQQQILKIKKQLQTKYQTMKQLKQSINNQKSKNLIQETSNNTKQKINQIKSIQFQMIQLNIEKQKLIQSIKDNQIDFQQYLPTKDLTAQIQIFKDDNKNLKKKVYNISLQIKDNQRSAKEALTKIYTLKKSDQNLNNIQNSRMNRIKSLSVLTNHQTIQKDKQAHAKGNQFNELKSLQQQIQLLKKKKVDVQSQLSLDKMAKYSAKQKKQKQITQLLQYHKKLFKRRVRQLTQLNYLQKKQAELKLQKQLELQKANVPVAEKNIQTQNIIKKQYRKDWIGKNQGTSFDDTQLLQYKQACQIKSLLVYRGSDRIVFIKFCYQHPNNKYKYQTKFPLDKQALKKIQNKKITSKNNGYLTNLTLSITKNIITRVQSIWSDGDSNVQGWETEESSKYTLDIGQKERPIAFFGTLVPHPKGFYALQSIGCQILQQQQ